MALIQISGCLVFLGMGVLHGEETSEPRKSVSVSSSNKGAIRSVKDVVFQEIAGEPIKADLYRPKSNEQLPTIIMIHGGAWMTGDKWNVIDHAIQMAESGFVVMAINYRLAPAHPWPAQREDCLAALQWISEHRKEWNADLERLGVWGYSAGGHLALMIALEQKSDLPAVRACVAGGPPCDLDFIPLKSQMLSAFLGGSREQYPERYREASPIHLLSPDDPPLYIFHGEEDSIVPIENSQKFHRKSLALGMANEYRTVSDLGHLMTFIDRPSRLEAIEFLKKHLAPASR
jgi:acetyl esterase/lipase